MSPTGSLVLVSMESLSGVKSVQVTGHYFDCIQSVIDIAMRFPPTIRSLVIKKMLRAEFWGWVSLTAESVPHLRQLVINGCHGPADL